jgi:hypothetical protein
MSAAIKRFWATGVGGETWLEEELDGDIVMHADHLAALAAANAYDEEKERGLFEQCMVGDGWELKLQRGNDGIYLRAGTLAVWIGWRSCAIARATLATKEDNQ